MYEEKKIFVKLIFIIENKQFHTHTNLLFIHLKYEL
jgi:hypothetical protein